MQRTNRMLSVVPVLLLLLLSVGVTGCVSSSAPTGWSPKVDELKKDPYGGWVEVYSKYNSKSKEIACKGELIAVHEDNILCYSDQLQVIAKQDIAFVKLMGYDSNYGQLIGWNLLGTLGTISNGWIGVLTMPVWLIAGNSAVGAQSSYPLVTCCRNNKLWKDLRIYARFPQGLPDTGLYDLLRAKDQ